MVLIDADAEYDFFSGDITRSFPANGRFTRPQQAVYEAVLDAQEAVIKMVKPGISFMALHDYAVEVITDGLISTGVTLGRQERDHEKKEIQEVLYASYRALARNGRP